MRIADIAEELDWDPSTVSRMVKYIRQIKKLPKDKELDSVIVAILQAAALAKSTDPDLSYRQAVANQMGMGVVTVRRSELDDAQQNIAHLLAATVRIEQMLEAHHRQIATLCRPCTCVLHATHADVDNDHTAGRNEPDPVALSSDPACAARQPVPATTGAPADDCDDPAPPHNPGVPRAAYRTSAAHRDDWVSVQDTGDNTPAHPDLTGTLTRRRR